MRALARAISLIGALTWAYSGTPGSVPCLADCPNEQAQSRFAPLLALIVDAQPNGAHSVAEIVCVSEDGDGLEFRVASVFHELSLADQTSVLNHEWMHYLDLTNTTLRLSLRGLPSELRQAILEIRAVAYTRAQPAWLNASRSRQASDMHLARNAWLKLCRWIESDAAVAGMTLADLRSGLQREGVSNADREARLRLFEAKHNYVENLLLRGLEVMPLIEVELGDRFNTLLASK